MTCIDHEKIEITSYDGEVTKVDSGISKLTQALTDHRIVVRSACEGHALFVDQTHYNARGHRAEIRMVHDEVSLAFIRGLILDSHFFEVGKVLWDIQFDWVPFGPRKNERRITLNFPQQDIEGLISYIAMKDDLAKFNANEVTI